MIVEWLLDWIESGWLWVAGLFPSTSLDVFEHVDKVAENLGALNYFLPISETIGLVVAVFAFFPVFLGVTLALWVAAQLRGSSSVG